MVDNMCASFLNIPATTMITYKHNEVQIKLKHEEAYLLSLFSVFGLAWPHIDSFLHLGWLPFCIIFSLS